MVRKGRLRKDRAEHMLGRYEPWWQRTESAEFSHSLHAPYPLAHMLEVGSVESDLSPLARMSAEAATVLGHSSTGLLLHTHARLQHTAVFHRDLWLWTSFAYYVENDHSLWWSGHKMNLYGNSYFLNLSATRVFDIPLSLTGQESVTLKLNKTASGDTTDSGSLCAACFLLASHPFWWKVSLLWPHLQTDKGETAYLSSMSVDFFPTTPLSTFLCLTLSVPLCLLPFSTLTDTSSLYFQFSV